MPLAATAQCAPPSPSVEFDIVVRCWESYEIRNPKPQIFGLLIPSIAVLMSIQVAMLLLAFGTPSVPHFCICTCLCNNLPPRCGMAPRIGPISYERCSCRRDPHEQLGGWAQSAPLSADRIPPTLRRSEFTASFAVANHRRIK